MSTQEHTYSTTIKAAHLDTFGHVNNATYLTILEEARWDLIESRGFGMAKIKETKLGPTILEINIKFKKELKYKEAITIKTTAENHSKILSKIEHRIFNSSNELCSEASYLIGLFDTAKRKLIAPTPEWLQAIGLS